MKAELSFVSSASVEQSGPTNLLDSELMRMEAETGYTCDITLSALIFEAILQEEGKCDESAEQIVESWPSVESVSWQESLAKSVELWEQEDGSKSSRKPAEKSTGNKVRITEETKGELTRRIASSRPSLLDRPLPRKPSASIKRDAPPSWGSRKASARPAIPPGTQLQASGFPPTGTSTSVSFSKPKSQRAAKPTGYSSMVSSSVLMAQKTDAVTASSHPSPPPPASINHHQAKTQTSPSHPPPPPYNKHHDEINLDGAKEEELDNFERELLADLNRLEESRKKMTEDRFGPSPAFVSTPMKKIQAAKEIETKLTVASLILQETAVAAYEGREPNPNPTHHPHGPPLIKTSTSSFTAAHGPGGVGGGGGKSPSIVSRPPALLTGHGVAADQGASDPYFLEDFSLDEKVRVAVAGVEDLAKRAYEAHKRRSASSTPVLNLTHASAYDMTAPPPLYSSSSTSGNARDGEGGGEFVPLQARTIKSQLQQLQHDSMKLQSQSQVIQDKAEAAKRRSQGFSTPSLTPSTLMTPLDQSRQVGWEIPDSRKDKKKPLPDFVLASQAIKQAAKDAPLPGSEIDWKIPTLPAAVAEKGSFTLPVYGSPLSSPSQNYAGTMQRLNSASSSLTSDWEPNVPRWSELVGISPAQSPLKYNRAAGDQTQPYVAPASAPSVSKAPDLHTHKVEEYELEAEPSLHTTIEIKPGSSHRWPSEHDIQSQPPPPQPSMQQTLIAQTSPSSITMPRKYLPKIKIPSFDFSKYEARLTKIPAPPIDQPSIIPPQSLVAQAALKPIAKLINPETYVPSSSAPSLSVNKKAAIGAGAKGKVAIGGGLQPSKSLKILTPLVAPPRLKSGRKVGSNLPVPQAGGSKGLLPPLDPLASNLNVKSKPAGKAAESIKPTSGRKGLGVDSARKSQSKKGLAFGRTTRSYQPNFLPTIG